ncbi:MAG: hypothetical protein ABW223_10090, partial [Rariglobus sp.]
MSITPNYSTAKSPIKNLIALLVACAIQPRSSSFEPLQAQVSLSLSSRLDAQENSTAITAYGAGTALATAGAGTYTGALLAGGVILRDPAGASRTDTTATAAQIIASLGLSQNYQEKSVLVVNTADAAETITLAGGTGVTL